MNTTAIKKLPDHAADDLYKIVVNLWVEQQKLPSAIDLISYAQKSFGHNLRQATRCLSIMEKRYKADLRDMSYTSPTFN